MIVSSLFHPEDPSSMHLRPTHALGTTRKWRSKPLRDGAYFLYEFDKGEKYEILYEFDKGLPFLSLFLLSGNEF